MQVLKRYDYQHPLCSFELTDIPPAPRGTPQIEVSFDVNADGILNVSALDKSSGNKKDITITNDKGRLTQEQIDEMISNSEKFKEEDEQIKLKIEARSELENYLYSLKNSLTENKKLDEETKKEGLVILDEGLKWVDENDSTTIEEYKSKKNEYEEKMKSIVSKMYQDGDNVGDEMGSDTIPTESEIPPSSNEPSVEDVD